MIGYGVRWMPATDTSAGAWRVLNLQTGKRTKVAHDYSWATDNGARHAAEAVHGGPVVYMGQSGRSKHYAGQD